MEELSPKQTPPSITPETRKKFKTQAQFLHKAARSGIQVTDYVWYDEFANKWRVGYYMNYFLAKNLMSIPKYLAQDFDVVGIVSGHGRVRFGKSTIAQQVGYFLAWLIAGGQMELVEVEGSPYPQYRVTKSPPREIHFNLADNIVFSPEELMRKADILHSKYGRNQVIIYDEGRAGLDSARAMEAINKVMQDFFQECGQYGHIILVVLPDFFKLHEDYAVNRSLFLIDVFANQQLKRGFFNFYNDLQKEFLYHTGKKKVGLTLKYSGINPSFTGRFTKFMPLPKDEYDEAKRKALKKKQITRMEVKWKKRLNAAIYLLKRETQWADDKLAQELGVVAGEKVSEQMVRWSIKSITHGSDDLV